MTTITGKVAAVFLTMLYPYDTSWQELARRAPNSESASFVYGGVDLSALPLPHQFSCLLGMLC